MTTDYLMFETISRDGLCDAESIGDCVDPKWRTKREDNDFKVDQRLSFQCGNYSISLLPLTIYCVNHKFTQPLFCNLFVTFQRHNQKY